MGKNVTGEHDQFGLAGGKRKLRTKYANNKNGKRKVRSFWGKKKKMALFNHELDRPTKEGKQNGEKPNVV